MDKYYKLKDIPKGHGRKLKFIFTYCRLSLFLIIFGIIIVSYVSYITFFRPRKDVAISLYSDSYNYKDQALLTTGLESTFDWDYNQDGIVKVVLNAVSFSKEFSKLPEGERDSIIVMLATGDCNIFFASDLAFDWLKSIDFLGKWSDFGDLMGHDPDEIFCVKAGTCPYFQGDRKDFYDDINICISIKTDATDLDLYEKEMSYLKELIEYGR